MSWGAEWATTFSTSGQKGSSCPREKQVAGPQPGCGWGWTTVFMERASQKGRATEWEPQSKCCLRNRSPKAQQTPLCLINIPVATPSLAHGCLGFLCDLGKGRLHQLKMKTNFPPFPSHPWEGFRLSRFFISLQN